MAHSQRSGCETDTIDLTLSSPEPEPGPQSRPNEHTHASPRRTSPYSITRVKQESDHFPRIKSESSQPSHIKTESVQPSRVQKHPSQLLGPSRTPVAPQQTRHVHPSHLQAILSTTSPHVLRKVLLELCQISPALSGALVRGLAPYSASAQNIIRHHQVSSQQSDAGTQDDYDSDFSYEAVRRMPGSAPYNHRTNRLPGQKFGDRTVPTKHHTHGLQSISRAEQKPYRPSNPSSDGELRRPGPSAQKETHPNVVRMPLRKLPKGSPTVKRTPDTLTQQTAEAQKKITRATMTCIRCHESFSDDSEPCIYHPGERIKQEDGTIIWSCCYEDTLSVGCDFGGNHLTESDRPEDMPVQPVALSR